jgi:hypothetical protein
VCVTVDVWFPSTTEYFQGICILSYCSLSFLAIIVVLFFLLPRIVDDDVHWLFAFAFAVAVALGYGILVMFRLVCFGRAWLDNQLIDMISLPPITLLWTPPTQRDVISIEFSSYCALVAAIVVTALLWRPQAFSNMMKFSIGDELARRRRSASRSPRRRRRS